MDAKQAIEKINEILKAKGSQEEIENAIYAVKEKDELKQVLKAKFSAEVKALIKSRLVLLDIL